MTFGLVAADHTIDVWITPESFEQLGDLAVGVLEVIIDGHHHRSGGFLQPGDQRGELTDVPQQVDPHHAVESLSASATMAGHVTASGDPSLTSTISNDDPSPSKVSMRFWVNRPSHSPLQ